MGEKVLQLILRRDATYYICSLVAFIHVNYWAKIAGLCGANFWLHTFVLLDRDRQKHIAGKRSEIGQLGSS